MLFQNNGAALDEAIYDNTQNVKVHYKNGI